MSAPQLAYTLDDEVIEAPLEPVGNYILVKLFPVVSRSAGGVVLPDQVRDKDRETKPMLSTCCAPTLEIATDSRTSMISLVDEIWTRLGPPPSR